MLKVQIKRMSIGLLFMLASFFLTFTLTVQHLIHTPQHIQPNPQILMDPPVPQPIQPNPQILQDPLVPQLIQPNPQILLDPLVLQLIQPNPQILQDPLVPQPIQPNPQILQDPLALQLILLIPIPLKLPLIQQIQLQLKRQRKKIFNINKLRKVIIFHYLFIIFSAQRHQEMVHAFKINTDLLRP